MGGKIEFELDKKASPMAIVSIAAADYFFLFLCFWFVNSLIVFFIEITSFFKSLTSVTSSSFFQKL